MINKLTVDKIMEATDIVEVIGEFVVLKKRGANYVGLSPFTNEKTPSFTVSPVKGIFKDFSTGKGGSAVTFLMEHEKFSYPEALKWLAKKYGIEVEETQEAPENREAENHRESLLIVTGYASKFFHESLLQTDEGKAIGLSYYRERGFNDATIKKFELGYSPEQRNAFSEKAVKDGYLPEFLLETGLSVRWEEGPLNDRYRGRVIFPIHSPTGRVIAFGGRTLKKDKNVAKYVNSPESEIYHKSNVLYGFHLAKKAIREKDLCYLVEGYADVISLHQAGIENVVASSGTSLTVEQVKIVSRQTKKLTILYDGDSAGVKAAIRGLSLLYKESFNIKVVLFPEGNDPDSYVRSLGSSKFIDFIDRASKGLVEFYISIIDEKELADPLKKIKVSDDLAEIISNHPDDYFRSSYVKQVAERLRIDERAYLSVVNKAFVKKFTTKERPRLETPEVEEVEKPNVQQLAKEESELLYPGMGQEKEIIRLLLTYGNQIINWDGIANTYIGPFMIAELNDIEFEYPVYKAFVADYLKEVEKGNLPEETYFINHSNKQIADITITLLLSLYELSPNWYEMHQIHTSDETKNMKATILNAIFHLKKQKVGVILKNIQKQLQETKGPEDEEILLSQFLHMKKVQKTIADYLGIVITE
ncbi:DNA primase [Mucilaginibacter sp. HMF5004]|uniref:DNA primase n=1 Tax=Mucilaginibacter rivuli TaxID=2857527 RepID=UPI001C5CF212|nr:DNA primase [Mucilaginibacter rivuli]MBW4888233.1 DNA primase [Mucilaginibacter rivuli]